MDRCRNLAARSRHASICDECDLEALVLQHAKQRCDLVKLRHSICTGPLEPHDDNDVPIRSEEHTSELQSLMSISYAVFCLKKKTTIRSHNEHTARANDNKH